MNNNYILMSGMDILSFIVIFIAFVLSLYYLKHSFTNYLTHFHQLFIVLMGTISLTRLVA